MRVAQVEMAQQHRMEWEEAVVQAPRLSADGWRSRCGSQCSAVCTSFGCSVPKAALRNMHSPHNESELAETVVWPMKEVSGSENTQTVGLLPPEVVQPSQENHISLRGSSGLSRTAEQHMNKISAK